MTTDGVSSVDLLAFFAVRRTLDDIGYVGAVLVTDSQGIPKEFRCTHPIKPSTVQKALFGGNLEPHIDIDLCGKPLMEALTNIAQRLHCRTTEPH